MSRKRHSTDQIIGKLRQADVELGQGKTGVPQVTMKSHLLACRDKKRHRQSLAMP